MEQVLLYSIAPQHMLNILNGLKTIEVRKRDLPQWAKDKLARGEIVEGYGYCTKGGDILSNDIGFYTIYHMPPRYRRKSDLNGLVVVKFEVSGTTRYVDCSGCTNNENGYECQNDFMYLLSVDPTLRKSTCLTADEIEEYGKGKDLYAHHLKNIQPVNMELGEFYKKDSVIEPPICEKLYVTEWKQAECRKVLTITKAPQSFQSVWVKS